MLSNHLILCHTLLLLPPIPPSSRDFSNESTLCIRRPKYWSFSFSISPSNEHPGLISFRMDWLDLLAFQETLKSLLQHHSSKASIFSAQLSSQSNSHVHTCHWKNHSLDLASLKREKCIYGNLQQKWIFGPEKEICLYREGAGLLLIKERRGGSMPLPSIGRLRHSPPPTHTQFICLFYQEQAYIIDKHELSKNSKRYSSMWWLAF